MFAHEELSDLELNEILAAWRVPDAPADLRTRVFQIERNRAIDIGNSIFEMPAGIEQPWYESLIRQMRDLVRPRKLPPLEITSKPIAIGNIWGAYAGHQGRSVAAGFLIQAAMVALTFLTFGTPSSQKRMTKNVTDIFLSAYRPKLPTAEHKAAGGGGGGQRALTPVAQGAAPKFAAKQFIPPEIAASKPRLPVVPTISASAPQVAAETYGDPLSKLLSNSPGQGVDGLGSGLGSGLGDGKGNGYGPGQGGGTGGGVYQIGGDVSQPILINKVEPEYSEEARKAKYSGTVRLSVVVDEHGLPRDIRVVQPLGLGLDEKAIEAVARWRFRPAQRYGKPVSVRATVEVNFRLL